MRGQRRQITEGFDQIGLTMSVRSDKHHRPWLEIDGDVVPRAKVTQGEGANEQDLFLGIGCAERLFGGGALDRVPPELIPKCGYGLHRG